MAISVDDILGAGGRIAARLPHYEFRPQQLEMAGRVADAITNRTHLLVEAGTGVGKSFGYLVPAILSLASGPTKTEQEGKRRIIVSTHTISLQEQLMSKDIPLLNSVIPLEFSAVLGKGRRNYLSLRRLDSAIRRADSLFANQEEHHLLQTINQWRFQRTEGSRSEMDFRVWPQVWEEVQSDSSNCLGRQCQHYKDCHYFKARNRLWHADLIVVNHALFFVDLALRRNGISVLPDYQTVILDEAHTIQDVASAQLGLELTRRQVDYALNRLFNENHKKGLFVEHAMSQGQRLVMRCREMADEFFGDLSHWIARNSSSDSKNANTLRVKTTGIVTNQLTPNLNRLLEYVTQQIEDLSDPEVMLDLESAGNRIGSLASDIENWRLQRLEGQVYWLETSFNRYGHENVKLMASPIDIGPIMRAELFNKVDTCILTSATIAVNNKSFEFFQNRVGLTQTQSLQLGSPFDFQKQARLVIVKNMADPGQQPDVHQRQCVEAIQRYVSQTDGHAFVLCTSYRFLDQTVRALEPWLVRHSLAAYSQSSGVDRNQLLNQFKENPRGVLFGTDSFWQGVDVQGEALSNVIIPKLPFSVPGHPLLEARLDAIRQRGGNPFGEYQLPEAIIKLKQGFGRLIRSQTDTGMVVILDPRIHTKSYGRSFLDALPKCRVEAVNL